MILWERQGMCVEPVAETGKQFTLCTKQQEFNEPVCFILGCWKEILVLLYYWIFPHENLYDHWS